MVSDFFSYQSRIAYCKSKPPLIGIDWPIEHLCNRGQVSTVTCSGPAV